MIENHPNWTVCITAITTAHNPELHRYQHKQFASCCGLEVWGDPGGGVRRQATHQQGPKISEPQPANDEAAALTAADAWARCEAHPA